MNEPRTSATTPPAARKPDGKTISIAKKRVRGDEYEPGRVDGQRPKPMKPSTMAIAPATPGRTSPGFASSKTSPSRPSVMRIEATVGSAMKSRRRSQGVMSVWTIGAPHEPVERHGLVRAVSVWHAIQLLDEVRAAIRFEIDDVQVDRLRLVRGDGLAHGLFGPIGVAAAQLGDAADVGDGVVLDFLAERAADVAAIGVDGEAAPMDVLGAITAMFAAIVMNVPALAARPPAGAT